MTEVFNVSAYTAFENQLRTLCLHEFPCGIGTWRDTEEFPVRGGRIILKDTHPVESRFPVTLKDYGVSYEKTEVLEEYVQSKHSPWNLDYSWSNEARELREIAVKSPWMVNQKFILGYFKTLRIVNKDVTEVDKQLLRFNNLEELTLSANHLQTVNSRNLPPKLKVLEICANEISDLSALCIQAPPLQHLGLGYNQLSSTEDYITGQIWPTLFSLDLGHNNLLDLMDIVRKMTTLPKLRNLVLAGNPLSLIPGYRGYVIDSLRSLQILDDIRISADEKHHFKGLARRREYILDEAKVRFAVDYIKNLPVPEEVKYPEDQPEWPMVTRKYFIEFMFVEDSSAGAEVFDLFGDDDQVTFRDSLTQITEEEGGFGQSLNGSQHISRMSSAVPTASLKAHSQESISIQIQEPDADVPVEHVPVDEPREEDNEDTTNQTFKLAPLKSELLPYAEEIEMNWWKTVTRDNLLGLRDFFKLGMELSVKEEKVLSYPADQFNETESQASARKGKGKKDDKPKEEAQARVRKISRMSSRQANTPKQESRRTSHTSQEAHGHAAAKPEPDKTDKKKKKKELDIELHHMPAEYTTLATFHLPLEDFLDGEFELEQTFFHGETEVCAKSDVTDVKGDDKHLKKDKGKERKKPASALKKEKKDSKERAKSPRVDKKDAKGKGKGDDRKGTDGEEEENLPPPPLEVKISVQLQHWTTAMDSVKAEKERLEGPSEETDSQLRK